MEQVKRAAAREFRSPAGVNESLKRSVGIWLVDKPFIAVITQVDEYTNGIAEVNITGVREKTGELRCRIRDIKTRHVSEPQK